MRTLFTAAGIYLPDEGAASGLTITVPISDDERAAIEAARAEKLDALGAQALGARGSKYRPRAAGAKLRTALKRARREPGPIVRVGTIVDRL